MNRWNAGYIIAFWLCVLFCAFMIVGFIWMFFIEGDVFMKRYLQFILLAAAVGYGIMAYGCRKKARDMF